jgi:hypothetical protein
LFSNDENTQNKHAFEAINFIADVMGDILMFGRAQMPLPKMEQQYREYPDGDKTKTQLPYSTH